MKTCTICKEAKTPENFPKQKGQRDGLSCWCKICHCARSKSWRLRNPQKAKYAAEKWKRNNPNWQRIGSLRKAYGINPEQYAELLKKQNGVCAICGKIDKYSNKKFLCVDHIEGTLKIRGLLCNPCNLGIGFLKHEKYILLNAITYLKKGVVLEGIKFPQGIHRKAEGNF